MICAVASREPKRGTTLFYNSKNQLMEWFIMHRNGNFVPTAESSNQCKVMGHTSYNYTLSLIFPGTIKLDDQSFIVDHSEIDRLIQSLDLLGSCEQMQQLI